MKHTPLTKEHIWWGDPRKLWAEPLKENLVEFIPLSDHKNSVAGLKKQLTCECIGCKDGENVCNICGKSMFVTGDQIDEWLNTK